MPFRYCHRHVQTIPFISLCVYLECADLLMAAPKGFCDGTVLTKGRLASEILLYLRILNTTHFNKVDRMYNFRNREYK